MVWVRIVVHGPLQRHPFPVTDPRSTTWGRLTTIPFVRRRPIHPGLRDLVWKPQGNVSNVVWPAINLDLPLVCAHDAPHQRMSRGGALWQVPTRGPIVGGRGRRSRVPPVAHLEHEAGAPAIISGSNGDLAALRSGIVSLDEQVKQRLGHPVGITAQGRQIGRQFGGNRDVGPIVEVIRGEEEGVSHHLIEIAGIQRTIHAARVAVQRTHKLRAAPWVGWGTTDAHGPLARASFKMGTPERLHRIAILDAPQEIPRIPVAVCDDGSLLWGGSTDHNSPLGTSVRGGVASEDASRSAQRRTPAI